MAEKKNPIEFPESVRFNYIKGSLFRVGRVDGVIGNATPRGDIFLAFYNERMSLPDFVENAIGSDGIIGKVVNSASTSPGVVRELDMGYVLDLKMARSITSWLSSMIAGIEKTKAEVEAQVAAEEAATTEVKE